MPHLKRLPSTNIWSQCAKACWLYSYPFHRPLPTVDVLNCIWSDQPPPNTNDTGHGETHLHYHYAGSMGKHTEKYPGNVRGLKQSKTPAGIVFVTCQQSSATQASSATNPLKYFDHLYLLPAFQTVQIRIT